MSFNIATRKDTALLIASDARSSSKEDQKKCIMFATLADLNPITLTSNTGKEYCFLSKLKNINNILMDQPVGNWKLPLENSNTKTSSTYFNTKSRQYSKPHHQDITISQVFIRYKIC